MSSDDNLQEPELTEALLPPGFLRNPVHLLAFGFGSGTAARAPGTWGSLWIALALIPDNIYGILMAFTLFRLFDVLKPWPISWLDEYLPGGLGIMVDDVVAGFMALLCLFAIDRWLMPVIV